MNKVDRWIRYLPHHHNKTIREFIAPIIAPLIIVYFLITFIPVFIKLLFTNIKNKNHA